MKKMDFISPGALKPSIKNRKRLPEFGLLEMNGTDQFID
jgi:hypothetical protein